MGGKTSEPKGFIYSVRKTFVLALASTPIPFALALLANTVGWIINRGFHPMDLIVYPSAWFLLFFVLMIYPTYRADRRALQKNGDSEEQ